MTADDIPCRPAASSIGMTTARRHAPSGSARAAVRAHRPTILAELAQGWTIRTIFERHIAPLGVMSYRQFARYVRALRQPDATAASPPPTRRSPGPPPPAPAPQTGVADHAAGPQPRTFVHDPQERPGDYEELFGSADK